MGAERDPADIIAITADIVRVDRAPGNAVIGIVGHHQWRGRIGKDRLGGNAPTGRGRSLDLQSGAERDENIGDENKS